MTDQRCDPTDLQGVAAPTLNGNVAHLKPMVVDGKKNGPCARPTNSRKRLRKSADAEAACRGGGRTSSATEGLIGKLEMRHEDHCYSLQPPGSQASVEEWPCGKRKAAECDEPAAKRAKLQGTLWAQKWQR